MGLYLIILLIGTIIIIGNRRNMKTISGYVTHEESQCVNALCQCTFHIYQHIPPLSLSPWIILYINILFFSPIKSNPFYVVLQFNNNEQMICLSFKVNCILFRASSFLMERTSKCIPCCYCNSKLLFILTASLMGSIFYISKWQHSAWKNAINTRY